MPIVPMSSARTRAETLVREAFLLQGSELPCSPHGGGDRFLFDPFEVNDQVIADWREAHLDAVVVPTFCMGLDPHAGVVRQLAAWNSVLHDHRDQLLRVTTGADFELARASGRIGVLISLHFGDHFRTLGDVDFFHRLGERSSTVVVRGHNAIGSAHHERYESGLTHFGCAIVQRMNEVGMAVDIAHANERTSLDVLDIATKPVYVSHACAYGLSPHEKNKSDEVLRKLGEGGGLIAVQPASQLVRPVEPVELTHFVDQIEYIARIAGPQSVGLGFEEPYQGWGHFQGQNRPVQSVTFQKGEISDAKLAATPRPVNQHHIPELMTRDRYTVLTAALIDRGFSDEEIRGFLGENTRRVFSTIMAGDGKPRDYESDFRAVHTNIGHIAH
ncbi:membrane dipeptidase [Streptomyces sp. NPDC048278]|uniref:dipeptidase n=1 Tax=unclassified Streptomyces TaxID=2593676 RepID=UPI003446D55F